MGHSLNLGRDVICNATRIMEKTINKRKGYNVFEEVSVARLLPNAPGRLGGTGSEMLKELMKTFAKIHFMTKFTVRNHVVK